MFYQLYPFRNKEKNNFISIFFSQTQTFLAGRLYFIQPLYFLDLVQVLLYQDMEIRIQFGTTYENVENI